MNQVSGKILKQNLMILRSKFSLTLSGGHLLLPSSGLNMSPQGFGQLNFLGFVELSHFHHSGVS